MFYPNILFAAYIQQIDTLRSLYLTVNQSLHFQFHLCVT